MEKLTGQSWLEIANSPYFALFMTAVVFFGLWRIGGKVANQESHAEGHIRAEQQSRAEFNSKILNRITFYRELRELDNAIQAKEARFHLLSETAAKWLGTELVKFDRGGAMGILEDESLGIGLTFANFTPPSFVTTIKIPPWHLDQEDRGGGMSPLHVYDPASASNAAFKDGLRAFLRERQTYLQTLKTFSHQQAQRLPHLDTEIEMLLKQGI